MSDTAYLVSYRRKGIRYRAVVIAQNPIRAKSQMKDIMSEKTIDEIQDGFTVTGTVPDVIETAKDEGVAHI